ncbi:hypothetical protein, partial [Serratia marcescens]|uniref:hypothetical protein n=1 Tax=Serratia marcescens TaxID=615 RepID=UPI00402B325A
AEYPTSFVMIKLQLSRGLCIFQSFINSGTGNVELPSNFHCTNALLVKGPRVELKWVCLQDQLEAGLGN